MSNQVIQQLMQAMLQEKPHLAPLLQVLQDQPEQTQQKTKPVRKSALRKLKEQLHDLDVELQIADAIIEEIAKSLGACTTCCGQIIECEACQGKGLPGMYSPDEELVKLYLIPVLRQHPWILELAQPDQG